MVFVATFISCVILSYALFGLFWLSAKQIKEKGEKSQSYDLSRLPHPPAVGILKFIKDGIATKFEFHEMFLKWALELGPIYSIHLGVHRIMMLNTADIIQKAFNEPKLNGRPKSWYMSAHAGGEHGVLVTEGAAWMEQRRFVLRTLRDLGVEKIYKEKLVKAEAEEFVESLRDHTGKPVGMNKKFYLPVFNSLWMILTGARSENESTEVFKIALNISHSVDEIGRIPLIFVHVFPIMALLGRFLSTEIRRMVINVKNLRGFLRKTVEERKALFQPDMNTRTRNDLLDTCLQEIYTTNQDKSMFYQDQGKANLLAVMADFFIAGIDTTGTSLVWAILHIARNPRVQEKIHAELDQVVGSSRFPTLSDRPNCPYVEATINEMLRITPVANTSIPHAATADAQLEGYLIPKGSWLAPSIGTVHRDPRVWDAPDEFKPERFLSQDGKSVVSHPCHIPFSLGKRRCVGEKSARDIMFLMVSTICHSYSFTPDPAKPFPTLEVDSFLAFNPKPFSIVFKERFPQSQNESEE